ncbi:MAG: type I secretion C-terminal target domain-containing protein [Aquabacterium sp.]|uniref:Calx-beta domain-containing protein n=1 Tax=Aquabacterium sp. TaxID=1872578 RepID=UPI0025B90ACA|nr:Calx-beta domain-containing protein [Aquabacterium sp.]MBI5924118.1 type I secretion C-terminal target domain-containing protein [Aquabacterium sp.]
MPVLAMSAGKVTAIWGSAYVRSPDGTMRALQVGDKVAGGERIITDDNGLVQISPIKGPALLVKAAPVAVDKAIAGIESQDPDQAPAAGLAGGADGGMQPGLRVDRVVETVGQLSFDFGAADRVVAVPLASSNVKNGVVLPPQVAPQISINNVTVNEGSPTAVFTVTLDKPSSNVVTVSFATEDGSARATSDFTAITGTVTFQPGETSQTIAVPLINDAIYEGREQFTVKLSSATNASILTDTGTGAILDDGQGSKPADVTADDDRPRVLSVSDASVIEGPERNLEFVVKLSHASMTDTIVRLDLSGGDAHPAAPGVDTGDMAVYLGNGPLPLTIQHDDQGHAYVVVRALTPVDGGIVVRVPIVDDALPEYTESLKLQAAVAPDTSGAPVGDVHTGQATVIDNDQPYMLVQSGESTVEGGFVVFDVTLTHAAAGPVTVSLALASGADDASTPENESATLGQDTGTQLEVLTADGQWVPLNTDGQVTFEQGQTLIQVRVATVDDQAPEDIEFIKLQAAVISGETLNQTHANQTAITDNDQPYMLVQSGEPAVEGAPVVFDVTLTHAAAGPVTVKLDLASGVDDITTPENESATLGLDTGTTLEVLNANGQWDPVGADGLVNFEQGQTLIQVRVATVDDKIAEDIEFIKLQATVVSGDTLNQTHANQTAITDNDVIPGVLEPIHAQVSAMDTNLMIVLDTSGSMDSASGISGLTRLQAAIQAIDNLIDRYDQYGDVAVRLVAFASEAHAQGDAWLSAQQAKDVLSSLQVGGSTNFDYALAAAQQAFHTSAGKLANAQNVAYLLSDANPTLSSANPTPGVNGQSGNLTEPRKGDGIDAAEEASWVQFLNANQIKSYAIGMGTQVSKTYLDPIAYDGHASSNTDGVVVSHFSQLEGVLAGTTHDFVEGNLSAHGSIGLPGGDFQHVASITVDGVLHDYNPAQTVLTLTTALGGELTMDMQTGHYSYAAPTVLVSGLALESFAFSLLTTQGELASSTLDVHIDHTQVQVGSDAAADALTGGATADLIMGRDGADVVSADGGNDLIYGNGGNDELHGGAGDDHLIGGQGSDVMFGDAGSDVFVWRFSDHGLSASDADRAVDIVKDFDVTPAADQGDVLDLRDLLQGENTLGGTGNLDHYLSIDTGGADTVIHVAPTGDFAGGHPASGTETQSIVLEGVNLRTDMGLDAAATSQQVIARMLEQGKLLVDHA